MTDNGGPAFPQGYDYINDIPLVSPTGMSLRDYFAAHAPDVPAWWRAAPLDAVANMTAWRWAYADAMLEARERQP